MVLYFLQRHLKCHLPKQLQGGGGGGGQGIFRITALWKKGTVHFALAIIPPTHPAKNLDTHTHARGKNGALFKKQMLCFSRTLPVNFLDLLQTGIRVPRPGNEIENSGSQVENRGRYFVWRGQFSKSSFGFFFSVRLASQSGVISNSSCWMPSRLASSFLVFLWSLGHLSFTLCERSSQSSTELQACSAVMDWLVSQPRGYDFAVLVPVRKDSPCGQLFTCLVSCVHTWLTLSVRLCLSCTSSIWRREIYAHTARPNRQCSVFRELQTGQAVSCTVLESSKQEKKFLFAQITLLVVEQQKGWQAVRSWWAMIERSTTLPLPPANKPKKRCSKAAITRPPVCRTLEQSEIRDSNFRVLAPGCESKRFWIFDSQVYIVQVMQSRSVKRKKS